MHEAASSCSYKRHTLLTDLLKCLTQSVPSQPAVARQMLAASHTASVAFTTAIYLAQTALSQFSGLVASYFSDHTGVRLWQVVDYGRISICI